MKITMLTSVYGEHAIGGAERSTAQMVESLRARGHLVEVMSLSAPRGGSADRTSGADVSLVPIPLMQIYDPYGLDGSKPVQHHPLKRASWHALDIYNPWMTARVKQALIRSRPDVLFTHAIQGFSVGVWAAAKQLGIKLVHMVHDHALICPGTAMTRGAVACELPCTSCQVFSTLREKVAARPDAVVGPSQLILDRHRRFGWFRDVSTQMVIENALPAGWPEAPKDKDGPEALPSRPMVFGFLGRMDESKGADTLLQAASRFGPEVCRVKMAGGGNQEVMLRHFSGKPQMVEFCGVVNAAPFLAQLDVLVTVSRAHETFCNVVMEAGCLGVPSIVSDRGALPERVLQGRSGWIVPAGNADALAVAMSHCMRHPDEVRAKGQVALEARNTYSLQTQTDKLEGLLMQVVAGKP
ncbi:MAG: hypothetical protein RLZZ126_831 [Pseudomonadota bacterium]|jgi:glycogen synthase